jgi:tetratricopeptide (TPR) repeat protein
MGLGGVGKTQLVLELVFRTKDKHRNCLIIWIPATDMESLQQAYLDVAKQLGVPGWDEEKADVKKLVQTYLSNESAGQWLLVFDNADDVEIWITKPGTEQTAWRLIDYLPRSRQGCIIFTTRDRKAAIKLALQNVIKVPEMDEDMATELLRKCLVTQVLVNDEQDTKALLAQLTYLPLAIVQAAAYINENGIALTEYLSLLTEQEEDVIDLLSEEFEDHGRYHNVKNPVATTWLISFEQILRRDPLAADFLSLMACVVPKDIPQSLLLPGSSRKKETDAIGTLNAYSFINRRTGNLAFDLHRLVHLAMRNWLRKEELLAQWTQKAIVQLNELFPDHEHKNRKAWRTYLPHALYVLRCDLIDKVTEQWIELAGRVGMCLKSDGRYNEAEILFDEMIDTRKRVLGPKHPDTLTSMANLASTYQNQGRWKEAEELFVQIIEMRKRVLGPEHPDTLTSINNLASTYMNQGRWKEAEELGVQVIEMRKRVLGPEHPDTLTSMSSLASTYWNQGRWKEAEELGVQVTETRKRVLGPEHPDMLTSMNNLVLTYKNQGRWKEAEKLGVQLTETRKSVLGAEHPDTLTSMANLALTYWNQGRWKEAEELGVQVTETRKRVLGPEHPDTLTSMDNLVSTYWNQGRWKEAKELGMQVIETSKRVLGEEHPGTLTSMDNLASTYWNQGRSKEAEELDVQVMETRKRVLGPEHPDTLNSMNNLASTYQNQGRLKEAEELDVQVMETRKRVLGPEHPDTLISMNNLAFTLKDQCRNSDAIALMEKCFQLRKHVLGPQHPYTTSSLKWLNRWRLENEEIDI